MDLMWGKDQTTQRDTHGYLVLAAIGLATVAVTTICGYLARSAELRNTRRVVSLTDQVADQVGDLAAEVQQLCGGSGPVQATPHRIVGRDWGQSPLGSAGCGMVTRRQLLEAHLRDQITAEVEERERASYAQGYADGVWRRGGSESEGMLN